ncbi:MAG: CoA ester lyase [Actinomycetia bacterium]|nr:CoA ester lyase [Actinomycetes bacterium]
MIRSFLYVPGDRPSMLAKAPTRGADMLILDLEDAVAPSAKVGARLTILEAIPELEAGGARFCVRVNSEHDEQEADLAALSGAGIETLVIPKATSQAIENVTDRCKRMGFPSVDLVALIESARGLWEVLSIAGHPRVTGLAIGEEDLSADLGVDYRGDSMLWHPVRSRLVWAAASAGLPGPTGPVSTDIADLEGLRESTLLLRQCGFASRAAIHPTQVPIINEVLTPSEEELEAARQLVDQYDQALAQGKGAITDSQGNMIDEAVVRRARHLVLSRGG